MKSNKEAIKDQMLQFLEVAYADLSSEEETIDEWGHSPPSPDSPLRGKRHITMEFENGEFRLIVRRPKCSRVNPKIIGTSVFRQQIKLVED